MNVIVVGSGFGGMAAALRMRAKGYQVTLLERGTQLGGRARVFKQDGHQFDAGPTVITAPYLLHELFSLFNKNPSDYIQLKELDHWYRYLFNDGSQFDYVKDEQTLLNNIAAFNPKDAQGFIRLQALSEKIFNKGFTELSDKPFFSVASLFKHAPALLKLGFHKSVYKTVSQHIQDKRLRRVFTTQPLLVGGNPFHTTSIYLLILQLERLHGCHFSLGGTHGLVCGLEKLMNEVGIRVIKECTVTKMIPVKSGSNVVDTLAHGRLKSHILIYNGDPAYAYANLIEKKHRREWPDLRLKNLKYSMSMCLFYFGTNKQYHDVKLHTILYGDSYKDLLKDIFKRHRLNLDLSLYLYRPTCIDSSLAPEGKDTFYVLAPVPNLQADIDWEEHGPRVRDRILDIIARVMPDIRQTICTEKFITPHYFHDELLSQHGSAFSIQPVFTQSAYFRFHNRARKNKSLYFVGAGTHPGAGIPGVLSSAKLIDNLIPSAQS